MLASCSKVRRIDPPPKEKRVASAGEMAALKNS
jgi:hypothetical protein